MANTVEITWVNHASYLLECGDVRLISDPWIEGRVFNESWHLLSKSVFGFEDFRNVTHIWFSHEHPDHFFPPNIKKIPAEYRKNITVLFQNTIDHKVRDFCQKNGFREIIELEPLQEYELSKDLRIVNSKVSNDTDSWMVIKAADKVLVNVNDCVFRKKEELEKIKEIAGNKVDVLFTQFSYANWSGNSDDNEAKAKAAADKLEEIRLQIEVFKPEFTVPFASFVYFCHEDNFHMNEQANHISDVAEFIEELGSRPAVLYPGDHWRVGERRENQKAIQAYMSDQQSINANDVVRFDQVPMEELLSSASANIERCMYMNNRSKLRSYKPLTLHLKDYDKVFQFSYSEGLKETEQIPAENADVSFCSQNFKYCLDHDWGYDTIYIAGTFERPAGGDFRNFLEYQWIGTLNNKGERMEGLFKRVLKRLFS